MIAHLNNLESCEDLIKIANNMLKFCYTDEKGFESLIDGFHLEFLGLCTFRICGW